MLVHMDWVTVLEFDRAAVVGSVGAVRQVGTGDLERGTPCAGWTVRDLLAHMTAQHRGFAAAASGRGGDPSVWEVRPAAAPVAEYAAAADQVLAAFRACAQDGRFALPEISADRTFRAPLAVSIHLLDHVVHGWDVARALGAAYRPEPDLVDAALAVAAAVPDGPERLRPGAAFAPSLPAGDAADPLDRLLLLLGRRPTWPR
jgi:uncharacterized protein (TIGR03086 family)